MCLLVYRPVKAAAKQLPVAIAIAAVEDRRCMSEACQSLASIVHAAMRVVEMHVRVPRGDQEARRVRGRVGHCADLVIWGSWKLARRVCRRLRRLGRPGGFENGKKVIVSIGNLRCHCEGGELKEMVGSGKWRPWAGVGN